MKTKLLLLLFVILLFSCGGKDSKYFKGIESTEETVEMAEPVMEESLEEDVQVDFDLDIKEESAEVEPIVESIPDRVLAVEVPSESNTQPAGGGPQTVYKSVQVSSSTMPPQPKLTPKITPFHPVVKVPKYELGKFVYDIPTEMNKLETYTVRARISRQLVDVTIYKDITPVMDTTIRTSKLMQVELIDPTGINFKIVSQSAKQFIEIDEPTEWVFFVTPLNYGNASLSFVVSIIKDDNVKQTVYNDEVIIKTTSWLEVKLWFQSYWQWFTVVLLIPLIQWIRSKFSKKEK